MPITLEKIPGQEERVILSMGPQHPSTHGVLRLVLELDGETVVRAMYDIGYLHTGFEKSFEDKTYSQDITLTDRMDYLNPLGNNLGFCLAVEKLLDIEVPARAQWIRVLLTELTRIQSHLVWLGTHAIDLGAMSVMLYCFRERETVLHIFEMVSGQRMMASYFRIGGLALEPPLGWLKLVEKFVKVFPARLAEYEGLLTKNPIWLRRTVGIGTLTADEAIAWGLSGPSLRGSGVDYDIRKKEPYSSYEKFDFKVPTRTEGDVYARYLVRLEEIRQSLRIVQQAMDGIPEGQRAPHRAARQGEHEDFDRGVDLSLQNCDGRISSARRRSLSGRRIAARRTGLLYGQRRFAQTFPLPRARPFFREFASLAEDDRRALDCRRRRLYRQHRYYFGRSGPVGQ